MNKFKMFFIQTSTTTPSTHPKTYWGWKVCMQENNLPIETPVELKYNSLVLENWQQGCLTSMTINTSFQWGWNIINHVLKSNRSHQLSHITHSSVIWESDLNHKSCYICTWIGLLILGISTRYSPLMIYHIHKSPETSPYTYTKLTPSSLQSPSTL